MPNDAKHWSFAVDKDSYTQEDLDRLSQNVDLKVIQYLVFGEVQVEVTSDEHNNAATATLTTTQLQGQVSFFGKKQRHRVQKLVHMVNKGSFSVLQCPAPVHAEAIKERIGPGNYREFGRLVTPFGKQPKSSVTNNNDINNNNSDTEAGNSSRLPRTWEESFEALAAYKARFGTLTIPRSYHEVDPTLSLWVTKQRNKQASLLKEQREKLESIGFDFRSDRERNKEKWDEMFRALASYKAKHGDCNDPRLRKDHPSLAHWATRQRHKELTDEQREKLESIEFDFDVKPRIRKPNFELSWIEMMERLEHFKQRFGHIAVPTGFEKGRASLKEWLFRQRESYNQGILAKEREERLEAIGVPWITKKKKKEQEKTQSPDKRQRQREKEDALWQTQYAKVVQFCRENGHCRVPFNYEKDKSLGRFVYHQRRMYKRNNLRPDRQDLLDKIGFEWILRGRRKSTKSQPKRNDDNDDAERSSGEDGVAESQTSHDNDDDEDDEDDHDDNAGIGFTMYHTSDEDDDDDDDTDQSADEREVSQIFATMAAHYNPPPPATAARKPSAVARYTNRRLTNTTAAPNNDPPVPPAEKTAWEKSFALLAAYKEKHGTCNTPQLRKDDLNLGLWAGRQRTNRSKLTDQQRQKLESIGFDFETDKEKKERKWNTMFESLKAFKSRFQHTNVPLSFEEDPSLGQFVKTQRGFYRNGVLSEERQQKLESIGFLWSARPTRVQKGRPKEDAKWLDTYQRLLQFREEFGHCLVPLYYEDDRFLARWVLDQRKANTQNWLRADRKELLDSIGFVWDATKNRGRKRKEAV